MSLSVRTVIFTSVLSLSGMLAVIACGDDEETQSTPDASVDNYVPPTEIDSGCPPTAPPQRTCTNAKCAEQFGGEPAVCVANQCVQLKTPECTTVVGPWQNDDSILIGSLLALRGSDVANGLARTRSVELAVNEINQKGGIYTGDGCNRRPLALLECDDSNALKDPDAGAEAGTYDRRAAAKHLSEVLKVPGIIGPSSSANTVDIATNVTIGARTLIITPSGGAAEISTIDGGTVDGTRMVWRTTPSDALQAKALLKLAEKTEADLHTAGKATIKVAIVNREDAFGRGFNAALKASLKVNGVSWADAATAGNAIERSYPTTAAPPAQIKTDLVGFQPDIVLYFGFGEFFAPVMGAYEDDGAKVTSPIWLSSNSGQRAELLAQIATRPTLRARARGTSSLVLSPLAQAFYNIRFKTAYPDSKELLYGMPQAYDGTYLVALALTATKPTLTETATSIDVAKALAKMSGGTSKFDVGPDRLNAALEAVRSGETIDFNGASGPLDFDPAFGEAPGDYTVWCVRLDPNTNAPVYENATGQLWSFQKDTLEGTFKCE